MSKVTKPKKPKTRIPFNPISFLETAGKGRTISNYSKKEIIFKQGDKADSVFYIRSGKVKVSVLSKDGKEAVVAILGADEFIGEGCLVGQPKRLGTAEAMTGCVIMRVEKTEIARAIKGEVKFSEMLRVGSTGNIRVLNARKKEQ